MNFLDLDSGPTPPTVTINAHPIDPFQHGMALFHATPPDYERAVGWFRAAADGGD